MREVYTCLARRFSQRLKGCTMRYTAWITASILSLSTCIAQAATLVSESFEGYLAGSNLVGQGGWVNVAGYSGAGLLVGPGSLLSTSVLDGQLVPGGGISAIARSLDNAIDPATITTFSADAYAASLASGHNSFIGLMSGGSFAATWSANNTIPGWLLDVSTATGLSFSTVRQDIPGGGAMPIKLGIVLDGMANEIYGIYDFGAGLQQTAHFTISTNQIAAISGIGVGVDFRFGSNQIEYDNLVVQSIPEPANVILMSLGLAVVLLSNLRRRFR